MEEATLYNDWLIGVGIALVIVLVAAGLLIMVWVAARRILRLARAALAVVVKIKENTNSIWNLEQTNEVAEQILAEAGEIETHAGTVANALHEAN